MCVYTVSCMQGAHLPRLIIDLRCQFSGGSQDKGEWELLTAAVPAIFLKGKKKVSVL